MSGLAIGFFIAMMVAFCALSLTLSSWIDRFFRIVISAPLLLMAMQTTLLAGFLILALALIWCGPIAHLLAGPITNFIYSRGSQSAGHIPNYKYAREKALDGDFKEAIKMCQWELSKQPDNYEGLLLLATVHMEMKQPKLALEQVAVILKIPHLSEQQEREALHAKAECLNALH